MPIPLEIQRATAAFESFLAEAKDNASLTTRNQTYTMTEGVLKTFRAHLALHDAIRFADVLPPVLRAIFVSGWDPEQPPRPFGTREELTREAQSLRRDHNFSPDTCIGDVARALSRHVDRSAFAAALERLPADARAFWDPGA